MKPKKIALVVPWFGQYTTGGAETIGRELAGHLAKAGLEVEILTTCVRDFTHKWNQNFYKPAILQENNLIVRRFRVKPGNHKIFHTLIYKINSGLKLNKAQEKNFVENSVRSWDLENFLQKNNQNYDFFIFIPYLYGTTFFGLQAVPEKSILIGCLHDERYAYLNIFKEMYQKARALVYLSRAEKLLAEKIYGVGKKPNLIGGASEIPAAGEAVAFRKKFQISEDFVLYSGRREIGKNVPLLVNYFLEYKKRNPSPLKLILIGPEKIGLPENSKNEIIDLGLLSNQDKSNALAAARFLIQPSVNESFSIVIMEAWLNQKPVLVHAGCAVTRDFVEQAQAGLYFANYPEFEEAVSFLLNNQAARQKMGSNGRKFVLENLSWEKMIPKYLEFFQALGQAAP